MSHYQEEEFEDMSDDDEMMDAGEQHGKFDNRGVGDSDREEDENDPGSEDTSYSQARRGKDIQGIPWDRLDVTRERYRQTRLEQYKNYENVPDSGKDSEKVSKKVQKGGMYYDFRRNTRSVKSIVLHFQLRNLVWCTSKHDVYLVSQHSVAHWSGLTSRSKEILNVSGYVAPCEKYPGNLLEGFQQIQISTLAVNKNLLVAGGFQGELICKYINRPGISYCTRMTHDDNSITNAVDIYNSNSGAVRFMASNNDCGVRDYDAERFQLSKVFRFPWPVNHTSLSPCGKQIVVVGDSTDGILVDSQSGKGLALNTLGSTSDNDKKWLSSMVECERNLLNQPMTSHLGDPSCNQYTSLLSYDRGFSSDDHNHKRLLGEHEGVLPEDVLPKVSI